MAGRPSGPVENLFWTFSPEPKGQLIWNFIESIEATVDQK